MRNLFQASRAYFDGKHRVTSLADAQASLGSWFQTHYGQYLLQREQEALIQVMPELGAHRMMRLGVTPHQLLTGEFNHLHSFSIGPSLGVQSGCNVVADYDSLPLPSETVDTVLLHHALEFSQYPHEVLKEAARVLTPCGHMVLVVLNPISFFGLAKWPARLLSSQAVWRHHSLRHRRLIDWLRLLNCHPVKAVSGSFPLPLQWPKTDNEIGFTEKIGQKYRLPWGSFYIVVARKYVARPTLHGPRRWKSIGIPVAPAVKKNSVIKTPLSGEK
ncbi:MAG: class I SAM-dependent methyltransferase [Porticoccus sp.]|nr:class I SAM-dependent methyltransferase [Porticoccus sp.]MBQ0806976.1 class I SAM-dependent methyltransferase [Porticoccus sp.]